MSKKCTKCTIGLAPAIDDNDGLCFVYADEATILDVSFDYCHKCGHAIQETQKVWLQIGITLETNIDPEKLTMEDIRNLIMSKEWGMTGNTFVYKDNHVVKLLNFGGEERFVEKNENETSP